MASQALVGCAGIGLVVANAWVDDRQALSGLLGTGSNPGSIANAHAATKGLGMELIGVAALTLLAGGSNTGGNAALAILGALWLVWLLRHANGTPAKTAQSNVPNHGPSQF